jgi:hypothetical protein
MAVAMKRKAQDLDEDPTNVALALFEAAGDSVLLTLLLRQG